MNKKIIIATHGSLAEGYKSALEMIIGENENIYYYAFYLKDNQNVLTNEIKNIISNNEGNTIVFTDLAGGSVNQKLIELLNEYSFMLYSGINLPLILEIILMSGNNNTNKDFAKAIENARKALMYVNQEMDINLDDIEN